MRYCLFIVVIGQICAISVAAQLKLLPQNPHYVEYQCKPTILAGSTEHCGSVVNPPTV